MLYVNEFEGLVEIKHFECTDSRGPHTRTRLFDTNPAKQYPDNIVAEFGDNFGVPVAEGVRIRGHHCSQKYCRVEGGVITQFGGDQ